MVPSCPGAGRVLGGKADELQRNQFRGKRTIGSDTHAEMLREDHRSPWEDLETVVGVRLGDEGQTQNLPEEGRLRSRTLQ